MKKNLKRLLIIVSLIIISKIWIENLHPFSLKKTLTIGSIWSVAFITLMKAVFSIMVCLPASGIYHLIIDEYVDIGNKRTIMQFFTLGEKKYVIPYLILFLYGNTCIIALIAIIFPETLFGYAPTNTINIIWLCTTIFCLVCVNWARNLITSGKLDWVFGENLSDTKTIQKVK